MDKNAVLAVILISVIMTVWLVWFSPQPPEVLPDLPPPVATKPADLPLSKLPWESFERLCLRLSRHEGEAEHWQLYGTPGQSQAGIDILVRRRGSKYDTWQCKR